MLVLFSSINVKHCINIIPYIQNFCTICVFKEIYFLFLMNLLSTLQKWRECQGLKKTTAVFIENMALGMSIFFSKLSLSHAFFCIFFCKSALIYYTC